MSPAFFVLGPGRSGTSLLAAQLNGHPHLACGLESGSIATLGTPSKGWFKKDTPKTRFEAFRKHCHEQTLKHPQSRWGNKITTEQLLLHPELNPETAVYLFLETFPDVPIIFMIRDGRACVASKMKRGGHALEKALSHWKNGLLMGRYLQSIMPEQLLMLRYEQLIQNPEKRLQTVCDFLEVPFDSSMLQGTTLSDLLPEMYQHGVIRVEKSQPPTPEAWHPLLEPEQTAWGYGGDL
jgi:hypothetical protein